MRHSIATVIATIVLPCCATLLDPLPVGIHERRYFFDARGDRRPTSKVKRSLPQEKVNSGIQYSTMHVKAGPDEQKFGIIQPFSNLE